MVIERGDIWWAELAPPAGAEPGFARPVVVVQADGFNRSRIRTIVAVAISSNMALARMPGNVLVHSSESGLAKDSVVNVSQIVTLDRSMLQRRLGSLPGELMISVEQGMRLVLDLW